MPFDKQYQTTTSSAMEKVEYSTKDKVLRIHWRSGGYQDVYDVPMQQYAGLTAAASAGSYYHTHINPKKKSITPRSNNMPR